MNAIEEKHQALKESHANLQGRLDVQEGKSNESIKLWQSVQAENKELIAANGRLEGELKALRESQPKLQDQ